MSNRQQEEFADYIVELMQAVGPATARRMFGGYGIFLDGLMFGLITERTLYLKTDEENLPDFSARGLEPFTYQRQGKAFAMSYSQAPEDVFDDQDAMREWGNSAYSAALRAAARKRKSKKKQ